MILKIIRPIPRYVIPLLMMYGRNDWTQNDGCVQRRISLITVYIICFVFNHVFAFIFRTECFIAT